MMSFMLRRVPGTAVALLIPLAFSPLGAAASAQTPDSVGHPSPNRYGSWKPSPSPPSARKPPLHR
jgi:hypothetical protein